MIMSADFETTVNLKKTRVWAWALCEVRNVENFVYGNSIETLFDFLTKQKESVTLYFHNLKFDGEFILYYLLKNGYKLVKDRKELEENTFCTLISDKGIFYSIEICLYKKSHKSRKIKILDSLKVLPMSVDSIAKTFNLPISKLKINYEKERNEDHILTKEEIEYIRNDVTIVALALEKLFDLELTKMTTGSNALNEYKNLVGIKTFNMRFPTPLYDKDIRQAYRGGFTYLSPKYANKDIGEGIVLDVNSLYPSVMYDMPLPRGEGIFFTGKYEEDNIFDLYIQYFSCRFKLKEGKIPTIQLKHSLAFIPTEYLTSSGDEYVYLCLSSIDMKLFFEHYDVWEIDYISGWKFRSSCNMFKDYIDKWNKVKIDATISGNSGLRAIAKLMLNSLYGKFATNPIVRSKFPYLGADDIVHYKEGEEEKRRPLYIPIGVFVTSWARYKTISSAQKVYDRFIYADTDSLHLIGNEIPKELEVSDTKLGAWKIESEFVRARFLRQKSYIEDTKHSIEQIEKFEKENPELRHLINYETNTILKITSAGMPSGCYKYVNWDNFKTGNSFEGKLKINHVSGGIVFSNSPHTLRG